MGNPSMHMTGLADAILYFANLVRKARGLAELNDGDFPNEGTPEEKHP